MGYSKKELLEKYTTFIQNATGEELEVLEHMLHGWEGKRTNQYGSYIGSWLQADRQWVDDQTYEVIIPLNKTFENPLEIVHGGVTATLLDTAMGGLANESAPDGHASVTMEMKINYLKPGKGSFLRSESIMLSKSRRTIVTEGKVYNDKDILIAHATATFYIIPIS
ncbi:PaaI family thioesterase [Salibacterium salarium]|uniref:PaaI family thioesterase n=1 Tax=Salibacterium salarium TaxID=284579 RepID=A0A3R9QN64_9BACI|nr:PaaI family thioesterase [Salibacterium salarium]RSL29589.1 PaaI family thioesterase [Salibacterium salarium]